MPVPWPVDMFDCTNAAPFSRVMLSKLRPIATGSADEWCRSFLLVGDAFQVELVEDVFKRIP